MQKVQQIIGADLSKRTIDLYAHVTNCHLKIDNSTAGFKAMLRWIRQQKINSLEAMIVMEHTGLYSYCLEAFLHRHGIAFTKVNALMIKRSMGIIRGKSDKVDAARIARFGQEKKQYLVPCRPSDKDLGRLRMLNATRWHLVRQKAGLLNSIKEYRSIGIAETDLILKAQLGVVKACEKQICLVDEEISRIMLESEALRKNYELLQSIKGIGKQVALTALIKTGNFTLFTQARKFACYCGTAPFEHTSGSSIKGRTRVSHLADKKMKTLLDLAAKAAIQHDKELKDYYQKKIAEGKNKMATINIIRNKLIYRMFAVIKRATPFQENYLKAA